MPDLFGNGLATAVFVAGIALVSWVLLRRSSRFFGRRAQQLPTIARASRSDNVPEQPSSAEPDDMTRWEVHMHEAARQLSAQLDTKMSALGTLVAEADRAAARLEAALGGQTKPPAQRATAAAPREEIELLADYGFPPSDIASRTRVDLGEVERILRQSGRLD